MQLEALFQAIVEVLEGARLPHALIGAGAMWAHGSARASLDLDLLVQDPTVLSKELWAGLERAGIPLRINRGDEGDPLVGVVRFGEQDQEDEGASARQDALVDIVVLRGTWADRLLERTTKAGRETSLAGATVRVPTASDMVVLKLYAGGTKDRWDIEELLAGPERAAIVAEVDALLGEMPDYARELWARLRPDTSR
jgi:hypothetical protein